MFFFLPTGINYRTSRWPLVTFVLIGINVLIQIAIVLANLSGDSETQSSIGETLWLNPGISPWYSWFTSMFVHAGWLHLVGNMLFLFLFGCCVEDMIGRGRFLLGYLLGGFAAELAYYSVSPLHLESNMPLGGASGAISACMGMFLWLRADVEIEFFYFIWFFGIRAGNFEVPAWMAIGFWFLKDLFWMILDIIYPSVGGVAFAAHVGGLLAGLGLMSAFRVSRAVEEPASSPHAIVTTREILAAAAKKRMAPPPAAAANAEEQPSIYLKENDVQSGPFTLTQIQARLTNRELSADALYWAEGMDQWESVRELAASPL